MAYHKLLKEFSETSCFRGMHLDSHTPGSFWNYLFIFIAILFILYGARNASVSSSSTCSTETIIFGGIYVEILSMRVRSSELHLLLMLNDVKKMNVYTSHATTHLSHSVKMRKKMEKKSTTLKKV